METVLDMSATKEIVQCRALWDDFQAVCEVLDSTNSRVEAHLKTCTGAIAGLQIQSMQRPSAIVVAEYKKAVCVKEVWVISVSEHKMGKQGPARLTLTEEKHKLDLYVQYVRPACDPLGDHDKLLSLPGG